MGRAHRVVVEGETCRPEPRSGRFHSLERDGGVEIVEREIARAEGGAGFSAGASSSFGGAAGAAAAASGLTSTAAGAGFSASFGGSAFLAVVSQGQSLLGLFGPGLAFVIDGKIVTPMLNGSILPGITRDTVLALAKEWGLPASERRIAIDEGLSTYNAFGVVATPSTAVLDPDGKIVFEAAS